jgi:hypothetical protein
MFAGREVLQHAQKFIVPQSQDDFEVSSLGLGADWFGPRFLSEGGAWGDGMG